MNASASRGSSISAVVNTEDSPAIATVPVPGSIRDAVDGWIGAVDQSAMAVNAAEWSCALARSIERALNAECSSDAVRLAEIMGFLSERQFSTATDALREAEARLDAVRGMLHG